MSQWKKRLFPTLLGLVLLAAGISVMVGLVRTRPSAARARSAENAPLVQVVRAEGGDRSVTVRAQGTVIAAREVQLSPEVSGAVVWRNPRLVPGGRVRAGEPLLRIDARDYELAVEQQRAAVDRARLDLEVERGRKVVAEREWKLLAEGTGTAPETGRALALRDSHVRTAEVALQAAESAMRRARLALERTSLAAPFNGIVQFAGGEIGQAVGPGVRVATLVGTDRFWVQVSVPVDRLAWIRFAESGLGEGSEVRLWQDVGGERIERTGRALRLLGDVETAGRLARILVEVEDPLGLEAPRRTRVGGGDRPPAAPPLPLLLGSYVNVEIAAGSLENVVEIPRPALRENDSVYVMGEDDRLEIRSVQVAWRLESTVLVSAGVQPGERLVLGRLRTPVAGMSLRADAAGPAEPARPDAGAAEIRQPGGVHP